MKQFILRQRPGLIVALLVAVLWLLAPGTVRAQTGTEFIVNSTADLVDADIVDDLCDADPGPAVQCTLRAAIIQANATAGKQTIRLQPQLYRLTLTGAGENNSFTGDLDLAQEVDIIGTTAGKLRTIIDASGLNDRIFENRGAHVTFQSLTITGGGIATATATGSTLVGGGIVNLGSLTIRDSQIRNNSAVRGGGIFNDATLTIVRSVISNNRTLANGTATAPNGAGIFAQNKLTMYDSTLENNLSAGSGGGLFVEAGHTMLIERSLIAGNSAQKNGGGIAIEGQFHDELTINNSTLSGNQAGGAGGAISGPSLNTPVLLRSSTIAGNRAAAVGGIADQAQMTNVILANNIGGNCSNGTVLNSSFNLSSDGSCFFSDSATNQSNVSAQLSPLAFNGGPTRTHALLAGSPAINSGKFFANVILFDQRGALRIPPGQPGGSQHDIGAFEFNASGVGTFALTPSTVNITATQAVTLTLTWTHPTRWRDLSQVDLQLRQEEVMPLWVRFTEGVTQTAGISTTNSLTLYNSDGTAAGAGLLGDMTLLESDTALLDLGQSRVQGSGPDGQAVTLTLAIRLKEATAGKTYTVTLLASSDDGTQQGPNEAGVLTVGPFRLLLPLITHS